MQTVLNDIYPLGARKNRGQMPRFRHFIARYASALLQNNLAAQTGVCSDVLTAVLVLERISLSRILLSLYHDQPV